jgi:molybdenum cofactor biosynthesis protein B
MHTGDKHREHVKEIVNFGLVVTGDSVYRGDKRDAITPIVEEIISKTNHKLVYKIVTPNDAKMIREAVFKGFEKGVEALIVSGGTGLRPKDLSIDVLEEIAFRKIPGFGEIFRLLTYKSHGVLAWLTRASAYVVAHKGRRCLVFVVPGSVDAVELALKIILPEIQHAVGELMRD